MLMSLAGRLENGERKDYGTFTPRRVSPNDIPVCRVRHPKGAKQVTIQNLKIGNEIKWYSKSAGHWVPGVYHVRDDKPILKSKYVDGELALDDTSVIRRVDRTSIKTKNARNVNNDFVICKNLNEFHEQVTKKSWFRRMGSSAPKDHKSDGFRF